MPLQADKFQGDGESTWEVPLEAEPEGAGKVCRAEGAGPGARAGLQPGGVLARLDPAGAWTLRSSTAEPPD